MVLHAAEGAWWRKLFKAGEDLMSGT